MIDTICMAHSDIDGLASAAIVRKAHAKQHIGNIKFVKCTYGDAIAEDVKDKNVVIVDFSFPKDVMQQLIDDASFVVWIDHHETAMRTLPEMWHDSNIAGKRAIDKAACELAWEYYFPGESMPHAVKLIGDRDMWRFAFKETKAFCECAMLKLTCPERSAWSELLDQAATDAHDLCLSGSLMTKWCEAGKYLLEAKQQRIEKAFRDGHDTMFHGYKTRMINSNNDVSDIGDYCVVDKEYDIALIYSYRDDKWVCSLRSATVDVSKLAEEHGGGGHEHAAGFCLLCDKVLFD